MIGDGVNDGGGVKAEEVRGRRPVGRENSADLRREDAGAWPGKSAGRVDLMRAGLWDETGKNLGCRKWMKRLLRSREAGWTETGEGSRETSLQQTHLPSSCCRILTIK